MDSSCVIATIFSVSILRAWRRVEDARILANHDDARRLPPTQDARRISLADGA